MVHRQARDPVPLACAPVQVAHGSLADEAGHRVPPERDDHFGIEQGDLALGVDVARRQLVR